MRLTPLALMAIRGCKGIVPKLAAALKVSDPSAYKYIRENSEELTKAASLKVIKEETGLNDDQILEDETETQDSTTHAASNAA